MRDWRASSQPQRDAKTRVYLSHQSGAEISKPAYEETFLKSKEFPESHHRRTFEAGPYEVRIVRRDEQIGPLEWVSFKRHHERDKNIVAGAVLRRDDKGRTLFPTGEVRKGKDGQDNRPTLHR
jgi:hypothetical protein